MTSNDATSSTGGAGTCPDTGQLAALLGDAAHEPPATMAVHIEGCPACQRRLGELAGHGDWLEPLASGDAVTRVGGAPHQHEPALRALIDELRRRPHAALAGSGNDPELAFLAPTDLPGYIGQLGPYQVIEVVGRGGMGVVLKAHDPSLARIVAIKVMAPVLAASASARKRFVREARAAAAISHENVVTIHAVDETQQGLPYIVMQFVAGRSLDARIAAAGGPLPVDEILRIGMQAAAGLAAAHAQGLVHRDVKPANIMLEEGTGRAKLTDFGLAHAADDASVTMTGQVSGTPSFMAPEQARGERVDARADLFSLGCVLYAACAGRPAFAAPTPLAALRAVCDDDPPPLAEVNPDVPAWLAELVHRLLSKDPGERPMSAREVADALAGQVGRVPSSAGGGTGPAVVGRGRPRRARVAVLLGAAAIVCIGLLSLAEMTGITRLTSRWRGNAVAPAAADGAGPAASAPSVGPTGGATATIGPVVLVAAAGGGATPRAFASLAEAVAAAQPGDTVELRHDGPVTTPRVDVGRKALCVRAGAGFRPALMQAGDGQAILTSAGPLVLEGLALEGLATVNAPAARGDDPGECLLVASGGPVHVANCRFVVRSVPEARFGALRVSGSAACEILNSEIYALQGMGVQWFDVPSAGGRLRLDNVITTGRFGLVLDGRSPGRGEVAVEGATFLVQAFVNLRPGAEVPQGLAVTVDRSVVVTSAVRFDMSPTRREDRFAGVTWRDGLVIYDLVRRMPGPRASPDATSDPDGDAPRPGATEADVRFAREFRRPQALLDEPPEPGDFVLQVVRFSNGRMAPRRTLENAGANTGLVGPGPAYQAFQQSSAYATWRDRTEEALRTAP